MAVVLLATYFLCLLFMLTTHPDLFKSMGRVVEHSPQTRWSLSRALATLLLTSIFVAIMSEILLGAVDGTATALDMSQAFIGIVVPAVVGGAAESSSSAMVGSGKREAGAGRKNPSISF